MIVSVSRRCDIPAWDMDAFMADLDAGFRLVPNPFDARKVRRVSLAPEDVDCLVFWTRDPRPLVAREAELRSRGYPFIVQVTITGYPRSIEPHVPGVGEVAEAMRELAARIGSRRIAWRYDPVIAAASAAVSGPPGDGDDSGERGANGACAYPRLDAAFHSANFAAIADRLEGAAGRVIVSLLDEYGATRSRLARAGYPDVVFASSLAGGGQGEAAARKSATRHDAPAGQGRLPGLEGGRDETAGPRLPPPPYPAILEALGKAARERGLGLQSCAEDFDLEAFGITKGGCIDGALVAEVCGKAVSAARDRGQRRACRCAQSVDIGGYGHCPAGCVYCYARR